MHALQKGILWSILLQLFSFINEVLRSNNYVIYLLPFAADLEVWGKYIAKNHLKLSVTVYVSKPQYYRARKCLNFGTEDSIDQILLL